MARNYGLKITDETAEEIKVAWRLANPWAKTFWRDLEGAAVRAARNPGTIETAGRIKYLMHGDMLYALLPCGRLIAYPETEVVEVDGKYGPQARVSSLKASMHPKKGETAWPRVTLYGGLLAENATQAFCASLLRAAVRRLDEAGWPVVMHTHDEVLVEVAEDEVDDAKAALQEAMLTNAWPDLPLAADPEHGYSYDK
jgi:DNA polymerase